MQERSLSRTDREFASVYNRNIVRVYQICFLFLKNRADAEDAAQTVFERYLKSGRRFADESYEKAWFIVVTRNLCRDELKRYWKKKRADFPEAEAPAAGDGAQRELAAALLGLPERYKDALYLYYIEGYSVKEMSRLLRRNESTLRNHLAEGRRLLKIELGGDDER
jgi:RNA polymerase sigma-70 factor (ECF subfamily)